MSLDYTSMDDEHKLIARYAARLAAEAKVVSCYLFYYKNTYRLILTSTIFIIVIREELHQKVH